MGTYRAFLTRTITTTQHAVVVVRSSSEKYALEDIKTVPAHWVDDGSTIWPLDIKYIDLVEDK